MPRESRAPQARDRRQQAPPNESPPQLSDERLLHSGRALSRDGPADREAVSRSKDGPPTPPLRPERIANEIQSLRKAFRQRLHGKRASCRARQSCDRASCPGRKKGFRAFLRNSCKDSPE